MGDSGKLASGKDGKLGSTTQAGRVAASAEGLIVCQVARTQRKPAVNYGAGMWIVESQGGPVAGGRLSNWTDA